MLTSWGDEEDACPGAIEVEGVVEVHDPVLGSFVGCKVLNLRPFGDEVGQGLCLDGGAGKKLDG